MSTWTLEGVREALRGRPPARLRAPLPRQASVALILSAAGSDLEALFIRRAEREEDPWSGQIAFPGGRAEPGESPFDTAVRETFEEVGLDLSKSADLLGGLDEIQAVGRNRLLGLSIQPWVFGLRGPPGPLVCSDEVASAHWLRLGDLLDPARQASFPYDRDGEARTLPCIAIAGLVIWGLTYRMFASFADVLSHSSSRSP